MRYDEFRYLYPPRPDKAVPSMLLGAYEKQGQVAQIKMNGTNNVIFVRPDRSLHAMNRHAEDHKAWAFTDASGAAFRALPGKGWWVFVAELLHSKVPGIRDTNYLHDVLVADGRYLVGVSYADRLKMLVAAFDMEKAEDGGHYHVINEKTWIAKTYTRGFAALFRNLSHPVEEGLVLKNPKAPLVVCGRESANAGWQTKVRRPHKNYGF